MKIGIIGAGNMGKGLAKCWAEAGHEVILSFSRETEKLAEYAQSIGVKVGTPSEANQFGEVLMIAVPFAALDEALDAAGSLNEKVIISCVSGLRPDFNGRTIGLPTDLEKSVAEHLSEKANGAKIVEAFNLTFAETLAADSRDFNGEKPSLMFCGDDAAAKEIARKLIEDCGYEAIDIGDLTKSRALESLATIWVQMSVVSGLFPQVGLKIIRR